MRHLFALLLAALWSFAPVASFELVGSAIAGQHSSECAGKTPRNVHDHPRADNPWMILPGVEEHWIQIGCFVHRLPSPRPQPWEVGTCRSCHSGAVPADNVPAVVEENCANCHYAVTERQTQAPCSQAWCPIFVQPAFVNRNVTADVGWYIAGMNLNPLWR